MRGLLRTVRRSIARRSRSTPSVSLIVVAYDMERELPRTLTSLSRAMQRGVETIGYEIIVVDNGSRSPVRVPPGGDVSVMRIDDAPPSPVAGINAALAAARGELVGVLIDGARLASPGLIRHAVAANALHARAVIATVGFHLGPDVQTRSIVAGYDRDQEDALLAGIGWEEDGYRLFEISVFAVSSAGGWFGPLAESNALFLRRAMWEELQGFDERFVSAGGGLANMDIYARACALPGTQPVTLLGEGTFHQVHGGVATNATVSPSRAFHDEYERIRGRRFQRPRGDPLYVGRIHHAALPSLADAATEAYAARTRGRAAPAPPPDPEEDEGRGTEAGA